MEEKSPTVKTFYSDLADEVDQHFARALHSANANVHSQEENLVQPGKLISYFINKPCYLSVHISI